METIFKQAIRIKLVRTFLVYRDKNGPMLADSITYRALFSVFAGVLLGFSLVALWLGGNPEVLDALADSLEDVVPGLTGLIDIEMFSPPTGFTLTGLVSLAGLVGAALGAINSIRTSLHQLADERVQDQTVIGRYLRYLIVAVGIGLLLAAASAGSWVASIGLGNIAQSMGVSEGSKGFRIFATLVGLLIVFLFDLVAVALTFHLLSGTHAPWSTTWQGAALGAVGLVVLQQFSGLFVKGAASNPLLASFGALIALLLWFNLSAQVILLASTWIIVSVQENKELGDGWKQVGSIDEFNDLRALHTQKEIAEATSPDSA